MIRFLFAIFCLGSALSAGPCLAQNVVRGDELPPNPSTEPTDDMQWWPDMQLNWRVKPRLNLQLFGTRRGGQYSDGASAKQIGGGFNWSLHRNFSLASQYRRVSTTPTPMRRAEEQRFHIDAMPRFDLGAGFLLTDRNRFEFRRVNGVFSTRYRNRSQIERPLRFTWNNREQPVTPYFSVEVFFDSRTSRTKAWSRKQLYTGARIPLIKQVTFNGFYMRQ